MCPEFYTGPANLGDQEILDLDPFLVSKNSDCVIKDDILGRIIQRVYGNSIDIIFDEFDLSINLPAGKTVSVVLFADKPDHRIKLIAKSTQV